MQQEKQQQGCLMSPGFPPKSQVNIAFTPVGTCPHTTAWALRTAQHPTAYFT